MTNRKYCVWCNKSNDWKNTDVFLDRHGNKEVKSLKEKLTIAEDANDTLDDTVSKQSKRIEKLVKEVSELEKLLSEVIEKNELAVNAAETLRKIATENYSLFLVERINRDTVKEQLKREKERNHKEG